VVAAPVLISRQERQTIGSIVMPSIAPSLERAIDVREIDPRFRHQIVCRLFENLGPDAALRLIADHAPNRLRDQLRWHYGEQCRWTCLEEGPDVWAVRLERVRAPVAGPAGN
jgi:uncharacterized protein (DUF2249 family)